MARNERKTVKDKDKLKSIRKSARKRWFNKKSAEKALKNHVDAAKPPNEEENSPKAINWLAKPQSRREVVRTPAVKEICSTEVVRWCNIWPFIHPRVYYKLTT